MLNSIYIVKSWREALGAMPWERRRALVVVDDVLSDAVEPLPHETLHPLRAGEEAKSLNVAESLYSQLQSLGFGRMDCIIGIGGGTLLDLVAFVGATYQRGMKCILIPTTLLAQVDAAIGGKNGINLRGMKNVIGSIRQPEAVLIDLGWLNTLPQAHYVGGLSEVVKYGVIGDRALFHQLETDGQRLLTRAPDLLHSVVQRAVRAKCAIVESDEFDEGERARLNFGHTAGHAIELAFGLTHGAAVSLGMVAEVTWSAEQGWCTAADALRVTALLASLGLPSALPVGASALSGVEQVIQRDKKRTLQAMMRVPIFRGVGEVRVEELSQMTVGTGLHESLRKMCIPSAA